MLCMYGPHFLALSFDFLWAFSDSTIFFFKLWLRLLLLLSHYVVSDSLRPHGLWHPRHACPSQWSNMSKLLPEVCSNSCPLSRRCHLTISSSAASLSLCLQCFPVPESFPVSQLFALRGQNIGASASVTRTVKKKKVYCYMGWWSLFCSSTWPWCLEYCYLFDISSSSFFWKHKTLQMIPNNLWSSQTLDAPAYISTRL